MEIFSIIDIIIEAIASALSLFGNTLVICAVIKFEYLQIRSSVFVVTLAIADLIYGVIGEPCHAKTCKRLELLYQEKDT